MGYDNSMQYYPNAPKPMNPFEVTEGRSIAHTSSVCTTVNEYITPSGPYYKRKSHPKVKPINNFNLLNLFLFFYL